MTTLKLKNLLMVQQLILSSSMYPNWHPILRHSPSAIVWWCWKISQQGPQSISTPLGVDETYLRTIVYSWKHSPCLLYLRRRTWRYSPVDVLSKPCNSILTSFGSLLIVGTNQKLLWKVIFPNNTFFYKEDASSSIVSNNNPHIET